MHTQTNELSLHVEQCYMKVGKICANKFICSMDGLSVCINCITLVARLFLSVLVDYTMKMMTQQFIKHCQ